MRNIDNVQISVVSELLQVRHVFFADKYATDLISDIFLKSYIINISIWLYNNMYNYFYSTKICLEQK